MNSQRIDDEERMDEICAEFAALPVGTTVRFHSGSDFTTRPGTFRNKLHRLMRHRGLLIRSSLKGSEVYAQVTGPAPEFEAAGAVRAVAMPFLPSGLAAPTAPTAPAGGPVPVARFSTGG